MASRMLHYIITSEIANNTKIENIDRFIIGSLLPDASKHSDGSYDKAHFQDRLYDGSMKGINWSLFRKKYEQKLLKDSFYIGYMCHLISDAIWYKRMTDKYIRIHPKCERINYIKKGYEDFRKLNAILIDEYKVSCPILQISQITLDGIDRELTEQIFKQFIDDFNIIGRNNREELVVYPYEDIKKFISESVNACLKEISAIYSNTEFLDPSTYYTKSRP